MPSLFMMLSIFSNYEYLHKIYLFFTCFYYQISMESSTKSSINLCEAILYWRTTLISVNDFLSSIYLLLLTIFSTFRTYSFNLLVCLPSLNARMLHHWCALVFISSTNGPENTTVKLLIVCILPSKESIFQF